MHFNIREHKNKEKCTFQFFLLKILGEQILPCHKIGHGQPEVIVYMTFVVLDSKLLNTKFQSDLGTRSGWVFTIYELGGHRGHVIWTKYKLSLPLRLEAAYEI